MVNNQLIEAKNSIVLYQTEDGKTRIDVHLKDGTVWLTQKLMAELFQKDLRTISYHIKNIYAERELKMSDTICKLDSLQEEGTREVAREVEHYNLDVIISVGYRVSSLRGTQFRIWATQKKYSE